MLSQQFRVIGSTGTFDTNVQRQVTAGTVTYITAPAALTPTQSGQPYPLQSIIIYQIDYDCSVPTQKVQVGDDIADENTCRMAMETAGVTSGTRVYPNGFICRPGKAVSVKTTDSGDGVSAWIKITYGLS